MDDQKLDAEFDVVVVGGGSAGCVVAARLSEHGALSVCLVESGGSDRSLRIRAPFAFPWVAGDRRLNWGYETEPEAGLDGRRVAWPCGRVIGGSGSINGLVFLRGLPSDFDAWERQGAIGWGYAGLLPWFKRLEHNATGADDYRGQHGPISVGNIKAPSGPARAFVEACRRLGHLYNPDFNGADGEGVGFCQLNVAHGWRASTAAAYLRPVNRGNLTLMTGSIARRVLFDGRRAVGIEVERAGSTLRLGARADVVLCCGAINTPLLLLASGIGPAEALRRLGATPIHDLPGVGKNLQDHFLIPLKFRTRAAGSLNRIVRNPLLAAGAALRWRLRHSGPFAVAGTEAVLFARSHLAELIPDIQFQCANFSNDSFETGLHRWPGFMSCFYACRPKSRGEILLRDPAGRAGPRIHANYLSHAEDRRLTLSGYALAERIFATEPLRSLIAERISPAGEDRLGGAGSEEHMRRHGTTGNHPCGTARMGEDLLAVVDSRLNVRGVTGLHVIDASVMPTIPSSNIHAATIMIAERGSDLLLGRLRLRLGGA